MLSSLYLCPNENVLFLFLVVHAVLFQMCMQLMEDKQLFD